jgi:hypothetical protein
MAYQIVSKLGGEAMKMDAHQHKTDTSTQLLKKNTLTAALLKHKTAWIA